MLDSTGEMARDNYDEGTMLPSLDCIPYSSPLLMIDPDFKRITIGADTITISGKSYTGYYCSGDGTEWSGNFLNWAATSRLDLLRLGLTGGDRLAWEVAVGPDAAAVLTTQACEKAYRSAGGTADIDWTVVGNLTSVIGSTRVNTFRVSAVKEDVFFGNPDSSYSTMRVRSAGATPRRCRRSS